ncbi:MAG: hypothetical protein JWM68_3024 [Verrucomicrobiales bacterium]|nr:hypothetical protein [Verrucomicrobiales bacterium]
MDVTHAIVILISAVLAGAVNAVAGGGTLISYPALIWIGRDPIIANATSTVALWPGTLASIFGYRAQLADTRKYLAMFVAPSVLGGALGAFLLLQTPSKLFAQIVPFLILGATILRCLNDVIAKWLKQTPDMHRSREWWIGAIIFQFIVGIYGGYFGAGIGIMMLAAFGLLGMRDIHKMNALKATCGACMNGVAAAYFIYKGQVMWGDALIMLMGSIAGGYGGASMAQKLGRKFTNGAVIVIGLVMGLYLLVKAF